MQNDDRCLFHVENHELIGCFARGTTIAVPRGVRAIRREAFLHDCRRVEAIWLPDSVERVADGAFIECAALSAIRVDVRNPFLADQDGVLFNRRITMLLCYPRGKQGGSFEIPDHIWRIAAYGFFGSQVKTLTMPDSVTLIEYGAFGQCSPETVRYGGSSAQLRSLVIGHGNQRLLSARWIDTRREKPTNIA